MIDNWQEIPVFGSIGVLGLDLLIFGGDLVVSTLLSLGDVIPILSMLAAYVAPQVDWIPRGTIETLLMVAALLYIGVLFGRLVTNR